jgi:hypothetical protein
MRAPEVGMALVFGATSGGPSSGAYHNYTGGIPMMMKRCAWHGDKEVLYAWHR